MMLMSVSRLLMVSSFNLLFAFSFTQIPRIFVLEIVKALSVFGNGDSIISLKGVVLRKDGAGTQPKIITFIVIYFFFPADESTVRLTTASHAVARCM